MTLDQYFSQKRVLVTGAAGFIGSHLVERLLSLNAVVVGVDNFLTGREQNLNSVHAHPRFTFIQADVIQAPSAYLPTDFHPDVVLHFASPASPPRYQAHPVETYQVNAFATHELLSYLHQAQPGARFVFASTSEIYGDPLEHPQRESYWGNVNPNGIRSCYDEAKRLGETICGVFERDFKLDVRIVRIFNTYGPHMDPTDGRILPQLITQALAEQPFTIYGDGQQTRSYCYVTDLVEGILLMAANEAAQGQTVNLGNPEEYTILETADIVNQVAKTNSSTSFQPLPKDDPTRRRPDIHKAKELLGWEPTIPFREGLEKTIAYFKQLPT